MKTINLSKKLAMLAWLLLPLVAFFAIALPVPSASAAVCVPGVTCVTLPAVTVTVPVLRTVTVTPPAVVRTITVNGPVRTVVVQGPTRLITVTQTVTERRTVTQTGQQLAGRDTVVTKTVTQPAKTVTGTPAPNVTKTIKVPSSAQVVTLTKTKFIGVSVALVIAGALLALLLIFAAYRFGWVKGDDGNRQFLKDTVNQLKK